MLVDASALTAILLEEREGPELTARLDDVSEPATHAISVYETVIAVARASGRDLPDAERAVRKFLLKGGFTIVEIGAAEISSALEAFARYGKGRGHPGQLNMGDCFSYACAKLRGMTLLYKGDDFSQTDLA